MLNNDKYQNSNDKINPKSKCQIPKHKFCHLVFVICAYFGFCALAVGFPVNTYALNLDRVKAYFLNGDYKSVILEGEKIMSSIGTSTSGLDELYYILGLSYLKDGNLLRACDIFEIILREFKNSNFKEEAKLGLGDTFFLRGDFQQAERYYKDLIKSNPRTKLKTLVFYRLSQIGFQKGDTQQAKEYLNKLKENPSLDPWFNKKLSALSDVSSELYYTVQVGSFSNSVNAKHLIQKLIQNNYPAYMEEASSPEGEIIYRVRVGKLRLRQEAIDLEKRLSQEGYPTKVYP